MGVMRAARRIRRVIVAPGVLFVLAALAGCTAVADSGADTSTVGTVSGVGVLPASAQVAATDTVAPDGTADVTSTGTDPSSTTTTIPVAETIGARAAGNRLLMIGDSLTASISQRYGGEACQALVPLGWNLEVDAETGRFIDFGKKVLDERLKAGWDAAVIFLGNNYGKNRAVYQGALHAMLLRLVPLPTVVITTGLFRPEQADVNAAILEEAAQFTSVTVLDWATLGVDPSLTGADDLHLTDAGRRTLAYYLAATMGTAPVQPGACLKTKYTDDSAGSPNGPAGNTTGTKTTTKSTVKPTATTVKSGGTATTVKSGGTATTTVTSSSTAATTIATTTPTNTTPATTTPATTAPPPQSTAKPIPTLPPPGTDKPTGNT
jgi:hypothetical protein